MGYPASVMVVLGGAFVVFGLLYLLTRSALVHLSVRKKFAEAGNLRGRTRTEIVALVGPPNTVSMAPGNKTLLQWMESNVEWTYHISLLFDANGLCEGVAHEHNSG